MKRILLFTLVLVATVNVVMAQKVEFTASAPNVVAVDEQFRLTYSVNQDGNNFRPPDFRDFNILSGPSTSSNSSISIVNGQVSRQNTYTYTYILRAPKEGKFNITSASIQVGGKSYNSNSLSIEVVKASSQQSRQGQGNRQVQPGQGGQQQATSSVSDKEFYVTVEVNKTNAYQGEHIVATIKVYTLIGLAQFEDMKFPSYDGFWTQDIETPSNISLQRANVDGQIYQVGVIRKTIIFPQRSGELTIEPYELTAIVQKRVQRQQSIWDNFFGGGVQNVRVKVKSKPVKISVKPLPPNKPAAFKGAVGNLKMNVSIDKTNVKTNDAVTMKVKVSGNGNLKLIDPFDIQFPPDFEIYDPKISNDVKASGTGMEGSKLFEYLMIPRHAGDYTIPSFAFTYFDISNKQYKTETSPELNIHVEKGSDNESANVISGFSKEDVKFIGKDIRYIKNTDFKVRPMNVVLFGSFRFWAAYILPLILFVLFFIFYRKKIRENQNIAQTRNRRANKMAGKRLKKAALYLKQNDKSMFYQEILKAILGYLSDKLIIPVSELSKDNVLEKLGKYNLEQEFTNRFIDLLNSCEYAQYAPPGDSGELEKVYNDAIAVISDFEQKIR
ncbi:MAG: BatD family protein [Bacteroidia bacterium]|nr:BatD family protein [Bacteroidia bacterium]